MNSLHAVFAVRIRDLSNIAIAWEFVRFKNGSFVDRWNSEKTIHCRFESAEKVRERALRELLDEIDGSLYDEVVLFSEFPIRTDMIELSQKRNLSVQRVSAHQSDTLARLIDRALKAAVGAS